MSTGGRRYLEVSQGIPLFLNFLLSKTPYEVSICKKKRDQSSPTEYIGGTTDCQLNANEGGGGGGKDITKPYREMG